MTRFFHSASALTLAAVLATAPWTVMAQETESDAEQAAEETEQAADEAAQETEQAAEEAAQETEQAAEEAAQETEQAADEAAQETEQAAEETEQAAEGEMAEAEAQVEDVEGAITMQGENSVLASELMGATVFNASDEEVGDINDMIVSLDGSVEGVVIGVGGFLGIGEKSVAVEMGQISVQMDDAGDPRLMIDTNRESLEAAPEFVTAQEQQAEAEQEAAEQEAEAAAEESGAETE